MPPALSILDDCVFCAKYQGCRGVGGAQQLPRYVQHVQQCCATPARTLLPVRPCSALRIVDVYMFCAMYCASQQGIVP